jgi:hypothetical protein
MEYSGGVLLSIVIKGEEEKCNANTWIRPLVPKGVLYGRGTYNRLTTPSETIKPQEGVGFRKLSRKGEALNKPQPGARIPLLVSLIVVNNSIRSP